MAVPRWYRLHARRVQRKPDTSKSKRRMRNMKKRRKKSPLEGIEGDELAKKRAWAVLAVLSGQVGVSEASRLGKISPSRYYQLEERALKSMVQALSPQEGRGRGTLVDQLERAKSRLEKLEEEHARQKQLLRMARKFWGPLADKPLGSKPIVPSRKKEARIQTEMVKEAASIEAALPTDKP